MDLVDLIAEKRWLGQEFLTWLWYKSEERGGSIAIEGRGDIIVAFEKHMLLESGEGDSLEKIVCSGLQAELQEARTGLQMGKKLEQARITFGFDNYEYSVTLSGCLLEYRNVKLPKTEAGQVDGDNPEEMEAVVLERIYLIEELTKTVNQLFTIYLTVRLGEQWRNELQKIRAWIGKNAKMAATVL